MVVGRQDYFRIKTFFQMLLNTSSPESKKSLTMFWISLMLSLPLVYNEHRIVWRTLFELLLKRCGSRGTASPPQIIFRSVGSAHHLLSASRITNHSWWHVLYFEYFTPFDRHQKSYCQTFHPLNLDRKSVVGGQWISLFSLVLIYSNFSSSLS